MEQQEQYHQLLDIASAPMVDWDELVTRWVRNQAGIGVLPASENRLPAQEALRAYDAMIERLVRFREYMSEREGYGCGDQGHSAAVKQSNKLAAKIRKVLGFTYPKQDITF